MVADAKIQADIIQELKWTPDVTEADIKVGVREGIVTLSGYVPTYAQKAAAEKAAQRVTGVKAVYEEIDVKLIAEHRREDDEIAKAAAYALEWNSHLPENLHAKVENGWITLTGEVEWEFQRESAKQAVRSLYGVTGISNLISIRPRVPGEDIKNQVETALQRITKKQENLILVQADGTNVVLTGNVHTFNEKWDAENAAWAAPGVTHVKANLYVNDIHLLP